MAGTGQINEQTTMDKFAYAVGSGVPLMFP